MLNNMTTKELCFSLAAQNGTPGDEAAVSKYAGEILGEYMQVDYDALSNVTGTINPNGKICILLDAHLDRIGLVVRGIDENGFLLIDKVGACDERVMIGAEVTVYAKKTLKGIICSTPPHLLSEKDRAADVHIGKMAVDIGLDKQEAEKLVNVGDRAVICSEQLELLGGKIASGAFDNRSGVAAVIKAIQAVGDKIKNIRLTVQLSSQEEVGGSGSKAGAFSADADYAVIVDTGFGSDRLCDKTETIDLGAGPSIGIAPVLDRAMMKELKELAASQGIPYQHDVMSSRTGTNADNVTVTRGGVKTALLSIPLCNMHTSVEVIDVADVDNTARLIAAYILKKDGELDA